MRSMPPQKNWQTRRKCKKTHTIKKKQSRTTSEQTMGTKTPITHAHQYLTIIKKLLPHWETPQQARETSDGTHTGAQPPPDHLPYGLEKTLNTQNQTGTQQGAHQKLTYLAHKWRAITGTPQTKQPPIDQCLTILKTVYEKHTTDGWNTDTQLLAQLAKDTLKHSGHTPKQTNNPCPNCATLMYQHYTNTGLANTYHCPQCQTTINTNQYYKQTIKNAHTLNIHVTISQASTILNLPLVTISARVRRNKIKPVNGVRGRGAMYRLQDLRGEK